MVEETKSEKLKNQSAKPTYYYRYDGVHIRNNSSIYLSSFEVVGTTPKGIYINTFDHSKKLILNDWVKKYAYPTKEEALSAFIKRKKREIAILESRLHFAKNYLKIATSDDVEGYVTDGTITLELGGW